MRLATVRDGSRDGALAVIDSAGERYCTVPDIARSLQGALDEWSECAERLGARAEALESGRVDSSTLANVTLGAPLPRAYEWIDGSAYIEHILLARKARGAEPPTTLRTEPLVYQGGSGRLLGPRDAIELPDPAWGLDFEAELCAVLLDVPRGTTAREAEARIALFTLANDVTFRHRVPGELAKGFGFFTSKPATAFSPFAITPDELGAAWRDGRVHLRMRASLNDQLMGDPDAGEMHFSFFDLIEHIAEARAFTAGTLLGSGTVSNRDPARGVACLAERRMREILEQGRAATDFLRVGDRVHIEMRSTAGRSLFGAIDQRVLAARSSPASHPDPDVARRVDHGQ